jgi:hypothetical protein
LPDPSGSHHIICRMILRNNWPSCRYMVPAADMAVALLAMLSALAAQAWDGEASLEIIVTVER